jgi:hypothetical protein
MFQDGEGRFGIVTIASLDKVPAHELSANA